MMSRALTGHGSGRRALIPLICLLFQGSVVLHSQSTEAIPAEPSVRPGMAADTIRIYDDASIAGYYTSSSIRRHIQRYRLPSGTMIHGVLVDLDGAIAEKAGTLHVYGHEGGYTVPYFQKSLVAPSPFAKTEGGRQTVRMTFPSPIMVNEGQIFISIENLASDIHPLTDQVKRTPYCTETSGIDRFDQILGHEGGRWETGPYAFRYTLLCGLPEARMPMFARDTTVDDGYGLAATMTKYISCGDVDGDGDIDLASGGMLYLNEGRTLLPFVLQSDSTTGHGPVVFHDADGDGRMDVVILPGGGKQFIDVWTMRNGRSFGRLGSTKALQLSNVTGTLRADVDGDGWTDLVIGGTDAAGKTVVGVLAGGKTGRIGSFDVVTWSKGLPDGGVTMCLAGMKDDGTMDVLLRTADGSLRTFTTGNHYDDHNALRVRLPRQPMDGGLAGLTVVSSHEGRITEWSGGDHRSVVLPTTFGYANAFSDREHPLTTVAMTDERGSTQPSMVRDAMFEQSLAGCASGDLDNDGFVDLVLGQRGQCRTVRVLFGNGDGTYVDGTERAGLDSLDDVDDAALADLDGDGRLDVVVQRRGRTEVYRNRNIDNRGATLDLGSQRSGNAIGADVVVHLSDGRTVRRTSVSGRGLNIQEPPLVHVGLGNATIDSVEIRWPYPDARTTRHGVTNPSGLMTLTGSSQNSAATTFALTSVRRTQGLEIMVKRASNEPSPLKLQIMAVDGGTVATLCDEVTSDEAYRTVWTYVDGQGTPVSSGMYVVVCTLGGVVQTLTTTAVK